MGSPILCRLGIHRSSGSQMVTAASNGWHSSHRKLLRMFVLFPQARAKAPPQVSSSLCRLFCQSRFEGLRVRLTQRLGSSKLTLYPVSPSLPTQKMSTACGNFTHSQLVSHGCFWALSIGAGSGVTALPPVLVAACGNFMTQRDWALSLACADNRIFRIISYCVYTHFFISW